MAQPVHWDDNQDERVRGLYTECNTAPYFNTRVIGQYLDTHLLIPLLAFVREKNGELQPAAFKSKDLIAAQMACISKTKMVEYEFEFHAELTGDKAMPAEMKERHNKVLADWDAYQQECGGLLAVVDKPEGGVAPMVALQKSGKFNLEHLSAENEVDADNVEALYHWSKFRFECGNYDESRDYLAAFRLLCTDKAKLQSSLWGKLAADMLMQSWDVAMEDIASLRSQIDAKSETSSPLIQLQQRTWLMHWGLFVFFNHPQGRGELIDLFTNEHYLNAITTNAPHLLRYLAVAVITDKRRKSTLKDLVKVIEQCKYMYSDPITQFLTSLYVDFDFEGSQQKLSDCEQLFQNDFFIVMCQGEFTENARHFIFEVYCRIHQCIDIKLLSTQLNMHAIDAERWLVNLVREERLEAKIDQEANHVIMTPRVPDRKSVV